MASSGAIIGYDRRRQAPPPAAAVMRLNQIDPHPLHEILFENAGPRRQGPETRTLALVRAVVETLPSNLDAILVTGDLQGLEPKESAKGIPRSLGEVLAQEMEKLGERGDVPGAPRTGVILTGDMFAGLDLHRRGASGDPSKVWNAFAQSFRWVVGVAGNHDLFPPRRVQSRNSRLLDGDITELDTLRIGGVSGIIGDPAKPNRHTEEDFAARLEDVCRRRPDIVVLHESPGIQEQGLVGKSSIRDVLARAGPALVACGHAYWQIPLVQLGRVQVLNVDGRAVVLMRG